MTGPNGATIHRVRYGGKSWAPWTAELRVPGHDPVDLGEVPWWLSGNLIDVVDWGEIEDAYPALFEVTP